MGLGCFYLILFSISSSSKGCGGCVCGPTMLLIYCLEIPIGRSAFRELRDRCKKAAANPDNEDGQLCWRRTVQVFNFKLLMFKKTLIVQTSIFKPDNEDGQLCWRRTVQVYKYKLVCSRQLWQWRWSGLLIERQERQQINPQSVEDKQEKSKALSLCKNNG